MVRASRRWPAHVQTRATAAGRRGRRRGETKRRQRTGTARRRPKSVLASYAPAHTRPATLERAEIASAIRSSGLGLTLGLDGCGSGGGARASGKEARGGGANGYKGSTRLQRQPHRCSPLPRPALLRAPAALLRDPRGLLAVALAFAVAVAVALAAASAVAVIVANAFVVKVAVTASHQPSHRHRYAAPTADRRPPSSTRRRGSGLAGEQAVIAVHDGRLTSRTSTAPSRTNRGRHRRAPPPSRERPRAASPPPSRERRRTTGVGSGQRRTPSDGLRLGRRAVG
ncbi:hypothetical protein PsYK624_172120 [Phanerochaete sordida]|uniref:Uncharacterized protein n=1 Tax=Phanerochaete sordida TaxID=48140 RepID=A0A9P3GS64_9APHY|nr:hypothetical protein PsYK624_172120 [Phanerochaete sordida]